jgi:hypothetical protein
MPRYLPLRTFLQRASIPLSRTPSRLTPAYPPQISALRIGRNFTSSLSARRSAATTRNLDKYTPNRLPDAAWPYLYRQLDKMPHLDSYFKQVDSLQDTFIERLREAVAIPSISSEDKRRPDVVKVCMLVANDQERSCADHVRIDGALARGPNQSAWWNR